jgi:hypothetical protein
LIFLPLVHGNFDPRIGGSWNTALWKKKYFGKGR